MSDNKPGRNQAGFRNRRHARELALQTLYACETGAMPEWEVMLDRIADGRSISEDNTLYARGLVAAATAHLGMIDECIQRHAANWELKRMAALDRNVLRLAVAELFFFTEVPFKVVIDEAVELAKTFGTDDSGGFVNGIIDSINKERTETPDAGTGI
ncbi:MAG: transcription antitermination factor NusB [Chitinispirillaceae bacterium]|jgi:N utilization substance protein B|nr:transcription antitermination factor NusB [Chitinispirillaceae bacterium]